MGTTTSMGTHASIAQRTQPGMRTSPLNPFSSKCFSSTHRHVSSKGSNVCSSLGGNAGHALFGNLRLLRKLSFLSARSQVQACATRGEGDAGPKLSTSADTDAERGSSSQRQGSQAYGSNRTAPQGSAWATADSQQAAGGARPPEAFLLQLRQRLAEVQGEEEEGEEDYYDFLNSNQDIDFDNLEIDDKLLFEELGLTPEEVEQQRDLSRAGFTDPEGIEFDHDEVSGAEQELPQELKLALLDKSLYGPEAVVLAGFPPEEHGMVRAVLDASGGAIIKAIPVTRSEQLHSSVDEMIWSEEQDWSQPRKQDVASEGNLLAGGWGSKRTVLFSGLSVKAQATILELLDNCGLQGVIGCMALEQDGPRRLGDVLAAAVKEEREQQKHHRQKRLQVQQEQQRRALEEKQEQRLRQKQQQQQQQQQQEQAQEANQPDPFQNSPFGSESVRSGSLPLPEGWSGRVVDDLGDLGSLEDLIGKQARERMMQELKHDAVVQQKEKDEAAAGAAAAAAAAAAAGAAGSSRAAAQAPDSGRVQGSDEHKIAANDTDDDPCTRIIDAVIGPALSTERGVGEQGGATDGAGKDAEVAARARQREQELAQRAQDQEARVAGLQQQQQQQEAEQRRQLEEEQEVLQREVEAMLGQQRQQQTQQLEQQQPQEAQDASDMPQSRSSIAQEQAPPGIDSTTSSSGIDLLGPEGSDIFGGLPEFENTLDDMFAEAAPREGPSNPSPTTAAAAEPPPSTTSASPAAQGASADSSSSSSSSRGSNLGSGPESPQGSQARDEDAASGLPEFENPLDDLFTEAGPGGDATAAAAEEQQQMELLRAQEQQLQQEKQEAHLSEQGLSILELIQRGLREGAPAEELKQLIDAAYAIEQQPTSSPPATPGTPTASPPSQPTPPSASSSSAAPTKSSPTTSNPLAPTGASSPPRTSGSSNINDSGSSRSSSSSNSSTSSLGLRRVGRTGRGSIFNRAPKVSGSGSGVQGVSSSTSAPSTNSSTVGSASKGSAPGEIGGTASSSADRSRHTTAGSEIGASASSAPAEGATQPRSRFARSWNKAKPKVPYGPPPPPPPPPPEQQGLHTLRPEALRKLEGKNVQFVDLSKLPTKYRRQMADRMREHKEAQLMQQLRLQQAQAAQQDAQQLEAEGFGEQEAEDDEDEQLEGIVGGGSEVGSIVGSVSGTRRGRLAGMLERSLRRKVKVVRTAEQDWEEEEGGEEQESMQRMQQQHEQQQQGQQKGQQEEGQQDREEDSKQRVLSGPEVAELVGAARQQGLDPSRMLAEAMAMGVHISPQAAAAAGMRLPDSRLVAAAKRGIADQLQAAQAGPWKDIGDDDDEEEEEEGSRELSSLRSTSAAVFEERQRRMRAEKQAVWRQRPRTWRGEDEEYDDDDDDGAILNAEDGDEGVMYSRRSSNSRPRSGHGSGVVDVEAEVVDSEETQRRAGSANAGSTKESSTGMSREGEQGISSTEAGEQKKRVWGSGWARPRR